LASGGGGFGDRTAGFPTCGVADFPIGRPLARIGLANRRRLAPAERRRPPAAGFMPAGFFDIVRPLTDA
jgi:hypothetical protein